MAEPLVDDYRRGYLDGIINTAITLAVALTLIFGSLYGLPKLLITWGWM